MIRKRRKQEPEKLDRWLVSYADFITLLFATFVILYALSQVDITDFSKLNESIKTAFDKPVTLFQAHSGLMKENGDSILEGSSTNSVITPLMLEYASPKYEQEAFAEIKKDLDELAKTKGIKDIKAEIDDRGLVIKLENSDIMFKSGTATLEGTAQKQLDKIGLLISEKFMMHSIRVEGNTDNVPLTSGQYPSNWELSSARACAIVRYLSNRFKIKPDLFTAVGYGDTRPLVKNNSDKNRAKNRRVEIIVVRNKFRVNESAQNTIIKMDKNEQEAYRLKHLNAINEIKGVQQKIENKEAVQAEIKRLNELYQSETDRINKVKSTQSSEKSSE